MKRRYLEGPIAGFCFAEHKMGFVSGPRQCGKATPARMLVRKRTVGAYFV